MTWQHPHPRLEPQGRDIVAHPRLEGESEVARVMRFADLSEVDQLRPGLEADLQAWCAWKA